MGYYLTGAQYNPMVTLCAHLRGAFNWKMCLVLFAVQGVAGLIGGAVGRVILGGSAPFNVPNDAKAWVMEFVWTFALQYVNLTVCSPDRKHHCQYYALGVGFIVLAGAFTAGPTSGGVFNPAVGIAVCFAGRSSKVWIYLVRDACMGLSVIEDTHSELCSAMVAPSLFGFRKLSADLRCIVRDFTVEPEPWLGLLPCAVLQTACPLGGLLAHYLETYMTFVTKSFMRKHPNDATRMLTPAAGDLEMPFSGLEPRSPSDVFGGDWLSNTHMRPSMRKLPITGTATEATPLISAKHQHPRQPEKHGNDDDDDDEEVQLLITEHPEVCEDPNAQRLKLDTPTTSGATSLDDE